MKVAFISILNIILLNISLSFIFRDVEPYELVNIVDYYEFGLGICVIGLKYFSEGNIIIHAYDHIGIFYVCNYSTIVKKWPDYQECKMNGFLNTTYSEFNLGRISLNLYLVFDLSNKYMRIRIYNDNYQYRPNLSSERPFCFDFFASYNNLKINLKNPLSYNIYLNIQYFSNSTKGKIPTTIKLINQDTNKNIITQNSNSINILQLIEPKYNYIFEFSPPKGKDIGIHSMYCLHYSYYDNYYFYANFYKKSVPLIAPGKFIIFSTYDKNKVNITTTRYNITYYFKLNNTKINNCTAYHSDFYTKNNKTYTYTKFYNYLSLKTVDNLYYSISFIILKNFTHSYIELDLYPNDIDNNNNIGNFIEFSKTIGDEEYILEFLDNLISGSLFVIIGTGILLLMILACNFAR